jgi:phytanoyl-CoA hydroxylase
MVVFHGPLPHWSATHRSPRSRYAYTLHVNDARRVYPASYWIQRGPNAPARGLV